MPVQFPHSSKAAFDSSVLERVLEPTGTALYESPLLRDGYAFESIGRTAVDLPVACKSLLRIGAS